MMQKLRHEEQQLADECGLDQSSPTGFIPQPARHRILDQPEFEVEVAVPCVIGTVEAIIVTPDDDDVTEDDESTQCTERVVVEQLPEQYSLPIIRSLSPQNLPLASSPLSRQRPPLPSASSPLSPQRPPSPEVTPPMLPEQEAACVESNRSTSRPIRYNPRDPRLQRRGLPYQRPMREH